MLHISTGKNSTEVVDIPEIFEIVCAIETFPLGFLSHGVCFFLRYPNNPKKATLLENNFRKEQIEAEKFLSD